MLEIFAQAKNNYHVCLRLTDDKGMVAISEDDVKKEIEFNQQLFIMDYSTPYEDCSDIFKVELMGKDALAKARQGLTEFSVTGEALIAEQLRLVSLGSSSLKESVEWTLDARAVGETVVLHLDV